MADEQGARDAPADARRFRRLAEAEANYRLLAEFAADVVYRVATDGTFTWVSPSVTSAFGWDPEDLIGAVALDFSHPDDRKAVAEARAQAPADTLTPVEFRFALKSGGYRWVEAAARSVLDERGAVTGRVGVWRDVEDARAVRIELEQSREQFRLLAENATDLVVRSDPAGMITWVSPRVPPGWGWTPEDLLGRCLTDFGRPGGRRALTPGGGAEAIELRTSSGGYRWFSGASVPVVDRQGAPDGAVVGLRDITDELAARRTADADRLRLRGVLDTMIEPHVLFAAVRDDRGEIVDFTFADTNAASLALHGTTAERLLGRSLRELRPNVEASGLLARYVEVVEHGAPIVLDDWPYPDERFGGRLRRYDVRAVKVGDAVSQTWRDVTDRYEHLQTLAASQEQYRLLAENASDVVFQTDAQGVVTWVSPSVTKVLGYAVDDVVGRSGLSLLHPDDQVRAQLRRRETMAEGEGVVEVERLRFVTTTGETRWMSVRATPLGGPEQLRAVVALRDVTAEHTARAELEYQALHDSLTGLHNRAWVMDVLAADLADAARAHRSTAVFFVDLDNFKVVNESMGHVAGDEVLREVGRRISGSSRAGDRTGRLGGDEFVVLAPSVHGSEEAEHLAARLLRVLAAPLQVGLHTIVPGASIGIALSTPASTAETLLRDADAALSRAKSRGRGGFYFFDEQLHDEAVTRLMLETELRAGMAQGELTVMYQPIVELRGRCVAGHEALVRWAHPRRGLVDSSAFVAVAEESGLIHALGDLVLDQVCRELRRRPDLPGRIALNVSAVQLNRPGWGASFVDRLRGHGVAPSRLTLEITETAALALTASTVDQLRGLRDEGVDIDVDDFGTGFSSVAVLRELPVTGLKLDRSFVSALTELDSPANALAAGLAGLARGLHLTGVAEGIETPQQAAILRAQGWDRGQGYLFGRPARLGGQSA